VHLVVNGEGVELDESMTVAALLDHLGHDRRGIAVAVNEEVAPRGTWGATALAAGDHVEVLRPAQGG
jgi:sulfur carrier protein